MKRSTAANLLLALTISAAPLSYANADEPQIKITDSKLHPINYGADSLQHWVDKAPQGDAKRASALLRDLEKLEVRFGRIPASDSEQYEYVETRLKQLRAAIAKKSGEAATGEADKTTIERAAANSKATSGTQQHRIVGVRAGTRPSSIQ